MAKLLQPTELLKSLNDRQFHILLKFKELKQPIQFELNYHMSINNCQAIQKSCIDRKYNAWFTLGPESKTLVSLGGHKLVNDRQSEFRVSSELIMYKLSHNMSIEKFQAIQN